MEPIQISIFAKKLASIAQQQYNTCRNIDESDAPFPSDKKYWTELGKEFPVSTA